MCASDSGQWCDICHQQHYQINPACVEERRRRETAAHDAVALYERVMVVYGPAAEIYRRAVEPPIRVTTSDGTVIDGAIMAAGICVGRTT